MPVYALSVVAPVAAVTYAQVQARTCRFLGFAEREQILPRVGARYAEADGAMAAELALWSSRIERIAEELRRGAAAVAPTPNACRSCDLQGLCRIASAGEASDAD